jgi:hypothetical protein
MADKAGIVAWWGAILSSVVFLWDIYKWRTAGPKLRLSAETGMQILNSPRHDGKTLVKIEVANDGERPTTVTSVVFAWYPSLWSRLRGADKKALLLPNPNVEQPLPFELRPGNIWRGFAVQERELEGIARRGRLYCFVSHSHRSGTLRRRVRVGMAHGVD